MNYLIRKRDVVYLLICKYTFLFFFLAFKFKFVDNIDQAKYKI